MFYQKNGHSSNDAHTSEVEKCFVLLFLLFSDSAPFLRLHDSI
jgi:hypothetical protein